MANNLIQSIPSSIVTVIANYIQELNANPLRFVVLVIDISIVTLLYIKLFKIVKDSRAWQL